MEERDFTSAFDELQQNEQISEEEVLGEPKRRGRPPGSTNKRPVPEGGPTKHIGGQFSRQVSDLLKELALERSRQAGEDISVQRLLGEALNLLFRKYAKQPIAKDS